MAIELTNEQIYAIYKLEHWWKSKTNQLFEISGGAGTGKTTLIRYFIEQLGISYENVLFVAYMGKAASQMARNGLPAKTIHSAIYDCVEVNEKDKDGKPIFDKYGKPKKKLKFELKPKLPKIKLIVIDEASMVSKQMALDILSFEIPTITLGDLNQLPPVFGDPFFLKNPDVILTQVMRQKEDDPIVYLAQQVLDYKELKPGVYGRSFIIKKEDLTEYHFKHADMILTGTNRLRYNINNFIRNEIKDIRHLDYPHIGEKVICRKNNWSRCVGDGIYLTNGMSGSVTKVYRESFNKKSMMIDFKPDFGNGVFKKIEFDYKHMYVIPGQEEESELDKFRFVYDKFEFGYAITVHCSQGSEYGNVLYMHEPIMRSKEDNKKLMYTAITRASDIIGIVL